jgi:hypothetical protein
MFLRYDLNLMISKKTKSSKSDFLGTIFFKKNLCMNHINFIYLCQKYTMIVAYIDLKVQGGASGPSVSRSSSQKMEPWVWRKII